MKLNERISKARKESGLTQQALADAIGVTKGAVSHWEAGIARPREKVLEKIAKATDVLKEWLLVGDDYVAKQRVYTPNAKMIDSVDLYRARLIPVFGQAVGGRYGEFPFNGEVLFEIPCPPTLQNTPNAYAVIVSGDSMSPRYEDGEIVYVDPLRRVTRGNCVIAQILINDETLPHAFVKRFIKHDAIELILEQFNPSEELRFSHEKVISVHYISMAGEAL